MAVFKCKMCGGTLEIKDNESVAVCEYCGSKQTLPKISDERKANLYDRANHFRRSNEFDKAMNLYEQILAEDNKDAEAYWSIVLCRYGIEYVEDPTFGKRVPTVNRAQFTSIFADEDYRSAIEYADAAQKEIYEHEAKTIDDIQKGILAISNKEEPFDVFICYKETDELGRRTRDSVLATDLYHQLEHEGFKTFFSRITLEDKLGVEYEPYIFAALNSAKVMVVIGTKQEYFNAVWVKNEWSRFLALIKKGENKILIPAYRDMDPYDLPEEFSHLQAQDMSRLGFMQDLVYGIKKITGKVGNYNSEKNNSAASPILKRAFIFLEDGDWQNANDYSEKALDIDPENAEAYLVKLMIDYKVCVKEDLKNIDFDFSVNNNCQKALRYGDAEFKRELSYYIKENNDRRERDLSEEQYREAKNRMNSSKTAQDYILSAKLFEKISNYKDSLALAEFCREKAENIKKDAVYYNAKSLLDSNEYENICTAEKRFLLINGWKDSASLAEVCSAKKDDLKYKKEIEEIAKAKKEKRKKAVMAVFVPAVLALAVFVAVFVKFINPENKYNSALDLIEEKKFDEAVVVFTELDNYKDSKLQAEIAMVKKAAYFAEEEKLSEAKTILEEKAKNKLLHESIYSEANGLMESGRYEAASLFYDEIERYEDSFEKRKEADYNFAKECFDSKDYGKAFEIYIKALPYKDSQELIKESGYLYGLDLIAKEDYGKAIEILEEIPEGYKEVFDNLDSSYLKNAEKLFEAGEYMDAAFCYEKYSKQDPDSEFYKEVFYNAAVECMEINDSFAYIAAAAYFDDVAGYKDSKKLSKESKYAYVQLNMDSSNLNTYEYLKELKKAKYEDSAALYKQLYAWRVEDVIFNNSKESTEVRTSMSYKEAFYIHFVLLGGEPEGSTKIKAIFTYPDGYSDSQWLSGKYIDGEGIWQGWSWNQDAYLPAGTFKVKYYDEAGNKIGEGSVKLTN